MDKRLRIKTVNHVGVPIRDRKKSLAFYRDFLGLEVIPSMVDSPNIVWTRAADGTMVHLIEPSQPGNPPGKPHTAFEVEDFDEAVKALHASGYQVDTEPGERHDGQRYIFAFDPDGYRLEFTTASGLKPSKRVADKWGYTKDPD